MWIETVKSTNLLTYLVLKFSMDTDAWIHYHVISSIDENDGSPNEFSLPLNEMNSNNIHTHFGMLSVHIVSFLPIFQPVIFSQFSSTANLSIWLYHQIDSIK